jgi:hypothetical protein
MAKAETAYLRAYKSYSKRMSDHVAFALVVYTLMLIFLVTPTIESSGTSIFPYFVLEWPLLKNEINLLISYLTFFNIFLFKKIICHT